MTIKTIVIPKSNQVNYQTENRDVRGLINVTAQCYLILVNLPCMVSNFVQNLYSIQRCSGALL